MPARVQPKVHISLPFLYLSTGIITLCLLLAIRRYSPFTPGHWYLLPLWFPAAHLLSSLSFLITTGSPQRAFQVLRYSFLVYTRKNAPVHAQVAFLTSLQEEMLYRYALLSLLANTLGNPVLAALVTSLVFTLLHLHYGFTLPALLKYLDLFLFSLLLCALYLGLGSFYPVFILHGMRNFILKTMTITKEEYARLHEQEDKEAG